MRQRVLFTVLTAAALCAPSAMHAQDPIDVVANTIADNNSELKSQLRLINAQSLDDADANSIADPEVAVGRVWGRNGIGNKLQLDISQEFEWPGVYGQRSKAAKKGREAATLEYESARIALIDEAKALLTQLVYTRHCIGMAMKFRDNTMKMSEAIDKAAQGGELTILDHKKAAFELYKIDNMLATYTKEEDQVKSALQGMCDTALDLSDITVYPLQQQLQIEEYRELAASDPAALAQATVAEQEALNAKTARLQRFPTITAGYQHQAEMGDRFNGFTLGMNVPIFQGRHASKAAQERKEAALLARQSIENKNLADIDNLYSILSLSKQQMEAYNKVFSDGQYLKLLLTAYEGGQINVLDYLSEVQYMLECSMDFLEVEYNYHDALTRLNKLVK